MEEKALTVIESEARASLIGLLKKHERELSNVLPKDLTLDRWRWLIVNSIRKSPNLAGCTPFSFLNSVMLASNLGIEIRDRSAYLVPFGRECQLLIDYRAKIDMAAKAGVTIYPPQIVREYDKFCYGWRGENLEFEHVPRIVSNDGQKLSAVQDRGEIVAAWCAANTANGKTIILVMSLADIDRIRKRSRKGFPDKTLTELCHVDLNNVPFKERGPWLTDPERMVEKTVVHQIFNRVPQSPEMALSQQADAATDAENVPMPIAPELENVVLEIDPIYTTHPLVDGGGDTREAQAQTQASVLERKTGIVRTCRICSKPNHDARNCPTKHPPTPQADEQFAKDHPLIPIVDKLPSTLDRAFDNDECVRKDGHLYERNEDNTGWRQTS